MAKKRRRLTMDKAVGRMSDVGHSADSVHRDLSKEFELLRSLHADSQAMIDRIDDYITEAQGELKRFERNALVDWVQRYANVIHDELSLNRNREEKKVAAYQRIFKLLDRMKWDAANMLDLATLAGWFRFIAEADGITLPPADE